MLLPLLQANGNTHARVKDLVTKATAQLLHRDLHLGCVLCRELPMSPRTPCFEGSFFKGEGDYREPHARFLVLLLSFWDPSKECLSKASLGCCFPETKGLP